MGKAFLILADGTVFEGNSIGKKGHTIGETVFTTGMTGYVETLTDPSYYGQIVTQTFPLIGNYGVNEKDAESAKSYVKGYIIRELCKMPSNFRCEKDLDTFLKEQGIVGIAGIDTRALTKKLRESGVMNGMIISDEESGTGSQLVNQHKKEICGYKIVNAVETVQSNSKESSQSENSGGKKIVLFDFGAKANIKRELEKRGCSVTVVPYDTKAKDVIDMAPDGIMLSNGPGDPQENVGVIEEIRQLCEYDKTASRPIPIFGICLGHQMLALARGAKTTRLKYGHRGGNHPVKDLTTDRIYITSQNHGYAVESKTLPSFARETFINTNDETCEGVEYTDIPAFSVQFHPEACGGPHDTNFLFDRFMETVESSCR